MKKKNCVWVVEIKTSNGEWVVFTNLCTSDIDAMVKTELLSSQYPDRKFRVTKYEATR
jgi:hypothetical protein